MPSLPDIGIRPFDARSLALSVLLGLPNPALPVRALVAVADAYGIPQGTMRTALSRMVERGELVVDGGTYRLTGPLLERKAAQDIGRRPPPARWDGAWWVAVVTTPTRRVGERRRFRMTMTNHRMGELRPDTWMRPANLEGPPVIGGVALLRGELRDDDAGALVQRLWALDDLAALGVQLASRAADVMSELGTHPRAAFPDAIEVTAAIVRALRADPLLPPSLIPPAWPFDGLRVVHRELDRALGRRLTAITGG